jgi:hypothetical protein
MDKVTCTRKDKHEERFPPLIKQDPKTTLLNATDYGVSTKQFLIEKYYNLIICKVVFVKEKFHGIIM